MGYDTPRLIASAKRARNEPPQTTTYVEREVAANFGVRTGFV